MFFRPATRLAPPESTTFLSAAGLPASVLVGASASVRSDHELRAFLAPVIERRALHETGERVAPRQIALQRHAVQRMIAPCRIGEAFVALLRRGCLVAAQGRCQIAGEGRRLIQQERGMPHRLRADLLGGGENVDGAQPDERVGSKHAVRRASRDVVMLIAHVCCHLNLRAFSFVLSNRLTITPRSSRAFAQSARACLRLRSAVRCRS
jgi:hypothetical protein